jgi:hypothetical protein
MTDRPIPFSDPMVSALLAGRKTQTRRAGGLVVGISSEQAESLDLDGWSVGECAGGMWAARVSPGDRLWVREAYWQRGHWVETPGLTKQGRIKWAFVPADDDVRFDRPDGEVRLGRFMPRKYSRITLDVTELRVERLQSISRGDAMEEGCPFPNMAKGPNPVDWYADLWNVINGEGAWEKNPFVTAITFRVHLCNIDRMEA